MANTTLYNSKRNVDFEFLSLGEEVNQCNNIKYAAYRTATKLRIYQNGLGFNNVRLSTINGVLECHRILLMNNNIPVGQDEIEHVLHDIFFVTMKERRGEVDVDLSVGLTMKFLNNVYGFADRSISVLNLKVALVCLCSSPLQSKYQYWFTQLADHNLCLTRTRLQNLLQSLLTIIKFLSESNTFSTHLISSTLDSCFTQIHTSLGVNESEFICWVFREPQALVWLSTLYRMRSSEKVIHRVQCAVCGLSPITGLRYNCLRCLRYDLCQTCFFTGRTSKRHKAHHRIREYCSKTSSCETTVAYLKCLLDRLCGNSTRLQYLPAQSQNESTETLIPDESICASHTPSIVTADSQNPEDQLQEIISQIESESERLSKASELDSKLILAHRDFLREHLNRLKALKLDIRQEDRPCCMSTPMNTKQPREFELSPICDDRSWQIPSPSGFSTWVRNNTTDENAYTQQLQKDLDMVMQKLNSLLDSTITDDVTEETTKM